MPPGQQPGVAHSHPSVLCARLCALQSDRPLAHVYEHCPAVHKDESVPILDGSAQATPHCPQFEIEEEGVQTPLQISSIQVEGTVGLLLEGVCEVGLAELGEIVDGIEDNGNSVGA